MSGTSKAVLSICVLLLAGLVVYYGMAPVESPAISVGDIPPRNENNVRLFGRDLDAATAALGLPSPIVEITEKPLTPAAVSSTPDLVVEVTPPLDVKPTTSEAPVYYTVVSGDTLGEIAHKLLGSSKYAQRIASLNNIDDPHALQLGRSLRIPNISTKSTPKETESVIPDNMTTHVIQEGETLSDIAEDYFGSPHQWMVIWNANKSRILNPDRLKVGTSIVIPQ